MFLTFKIIHKINRVNSEIHQYRVRLILICILNDCCLSLTTRASLLSNLMPFQKASDDAEYSANNAYDQTQRQQVDTALVCNSRPTDLIF